MDIWPQFNEKMIASVTQVLQSGKVNQWTSPLVANFEKKFAEYFGCKYAVAVFNGTVALELCLKALDLCAGDEVIVTPRTFIASASCAAWYGIIPKFVDVDPDSQNITLEHIKKAITPKTKAVILVHLAGWPCQLEEICQYCHEQGIYVIEDCAQSHGAKYNGKYAGTWGDINAWSFCQDKILTTCGEGGMVTTNNEQLYKRAWSLKDHGKGYDRVYNTQHPSGFRWLHEQIGTNWRMLPIQACVGIEALDELDSWVNHRRTIVNIYNQQLVGVKGVRLTIPPDNVYHSYYKYYFFIEPEQFTISRDKILELIAKENIFAQIGSCGEVYQEKALAPFAPKERCHNAKWLFETSIMLKCDPCISEEKALKDITKIKEILNTYNNFNL
jgi:dTDP-4-amino-4,6-dideoxygalactose transaminase